MRRLTAVFPTLLLASLLAGCSAASGADGPHPATSAEATQTTQSAQTIDNCGTKLTIGTPPKRIVTVKSSATELLLALGLGKRIVGAAFLDGPIPKRLTTDGSPRIISDALPGEEAVLALKPDFIYAGWESSFSADGVGERTALAKLGIGSYVSPSACDEPAFQPDPLTFSTVFAEIDQAGRIFGTSKKAIAIVAKQKAQLRALPAREHPVTALWYSSATTTPYVGAGIGAPEMIMRAAGLRNIFADLHDTWSSVSWEAVAAADPQVIVLVDASWNTAAHKIKELESNPATKHLDAVVHHRFITVPFAATEAGVRNVAAAGSIVTQLKGLEG